MPRRPRPANRPPPKTGHRGKTPLLASFSRTKVSPEIRFDETNSSHDVLLESPSDDFEEGSSQGAHTSLVDLDEDEDEVNEEGNADAPRVVQWEDDDEAFLEEESEEKVKEKVSTEKKLQDNLQDLPLGALRLAKRFLSQAEPESESDESGSSSNEDSKPEGYDAKGKGIEKVEWSTKRRTDISKRSSKHAPTEVTSKRPVTRKRTVVDVPKIVPRDPRFLPTAGEFDPARFQTSYGFLADSHKTELATLRETLKQARKMLASSPRELKSEREYEVNRLEQAVKRTESTVNRDRLERVEREALGNAKKDEQDKQKQGKGQWYLKKADKQQLVMKARYEALAKEGGQRAVKRAIEKKQKKTSQKEKRSRPYAKGEDGAEGPRPNKRRRM